MKLKRYSFFVAVLTILSQHSNASEDLSKKLFATSSANIKQIKEVIYDKYVGGQISGDASIIKDSFSPDAVMLTPILPHKADSSLEKWLDMHSEADKWGASANKNIDINEVKILKLDVIDDRMATAQIKMEDRVYEVITLVKIRSQWKIASKVFISQR